MYRTTSYELNEWVTLFFEKNLQGDIVALYNSSGLKLVTYEYDAWGNQTVTYHAGSSSGPAQYNPFRYRGYYYDTDLGMYYLQSRYYDPNTCRFINADGYVSTGQGLIGNNMFAYCGNNPVNMVDPYGEFPWLITIFLLAMTTVGAVIGYNLDINSQEPLEGENEEYPIEELTEGEKIKNSVIGVAFGLAAGGVVILASAGVYGAIFGIGSEYLGVTALQGMAIGGLAMNIPAWLVLPIFGIEIEAFEYELPSYNTNQPIFD